MKSVNLSLYRNGQNRIFANVGLLTLPIKSILVHFIVTTTT